MEESFVDYLTGLANRRGLYSYYNSLDSKTFLHAIYLDVDNFKRVNDIYGHSMGDELLIKVSNLLKENTKGFCCRMGGDEFVVLLDASMTTSQVEDLAKLYKKRLEVIEFRTDILSLISLSIGIVFNQSVTQPLDDMLYKCDTAMYQAKYDGKNQFKVFSENDKKMLMQKSIELEMEKALENGEFQLYLQPEINMVTSQLYCAEALSRWHHPTDGIRLPEDYIPVFEKNGFITKLNLFIFEELCKTKKSWKNTPFEHLSVSINISRINLYDKTFIEKLTSIAEKYEINPKEIDIEIKEAVYLKDSDVIKLFSKSLEEKNFKLSIDDYGNEFATLKLLRDMPVHNIKLSQRFLIECLATNRGKDMFKNLIILALAIRQEIIVSGIETEEQADFVFKSGCQIAQGNYFNTALPAKEFPKISEKYSVYKEESYFFAFNGNLSDNEKNIQGTYIGNNPPEYAEGIFSDSLAIVFPGGETHTNVISLPKEIISSDSYTISMWIYPEELHLYSSTFFLYYESGFTSLMPLAWEGHSDFRMHYIPRPLEWFDASACVLPLKKWTMLSATFNAKAGRMRICTNGMAMQEIENAPIQRILKEILIGGDMFQQSFKGRICNLQIFNEAKDHQFFKDLYDNTVKNPKFTKNHIK